jgi:hypothetical protein
MCANYDKGCRNRTSAPNDKICWIKFKKCGNCAAIEHPEVYSKTYVKKILGQKKLRENAISM